MSEGTKTPIDGGMIARALAGVKGWAQGFFTPVAPQAPVAQQTQGRAFDYQTGFNMTRSPRQEEAGSVSFAQLRAFADSYDLLRLVIETRKDQLCGLSWNIVGRESDDGIKNSDPRVKEIERFFRKPDGLLVWNDWLRTLVEDLLVIDAPTIYPRLTNGGKLHSLEIIDGATIKILIDENGRIPLSPMPAYAQIIKGMPASHYTREELLYRPRNRRSWKMYGYSPVEQIMMTVNIALRRQMTQLQYYTEGNIPEAFATTPVEWSPQQVKEMQTIWDSLIAGQPEMKRHLKFIPGGTDIKFSREPELKSLFDEWLARLVCYAFSVSPQALVAIMNRATAESAAETAELEGLAPLQSWVKAIMDDVIENHFGYDDLVFEWDGGEELDPKAQAEIHKIYVDAQVLDIDEVRKDIGRDPRSKRDAERGAEGTSPSPKAPNAEGDQLSGDGGASGTVAAGGVPSGTPDDPNAAPPQLDAEGNPIATPVAGEAKVADAAMNGTQISSLVEIVNLVAGKDLPKETATAMIMAAFPMVPKETIDAMLNPLDNFEPPKPDPIVGPDGQPIAPGVASESPDDETIKPDKAAADDETSAPGATPKKAAVEKLHKHAHGKANVLNSARKDLGNAIEDVLKSIAEDVARQVQEERTETVQKQFGKSKNDTVFNVKRFLAKLDISFEGLEEKLYESLELVAKNGAAGALRSLGKKYMDGLDLANSRAEKWAAGRAGELIKTSGKGGELAEATREMLRTTIVEAEAQGWSNETLANELRDNYAFSKARAKTIARTELKSADSEGAIAGWRATGLKMKKEWIRSANDADCDICEANESQGPIDLDDTFDSGDDTSPAHPNCECVVQTVLDEEQEL